MFPQRADSDEEGNDDDRHDNMFNEPSKEQRTEVGDRER